MLVSILADRLGFVILSDVQSDFALSDYITDSLLFIQLIVVIEEEIGSQLSDDFLNYEILSSAKGFAEKLNCFIDNTKNDIPN